ncbi:tRNA 4-thiouridine(8) synthase ThiI [Patescibacteria group bacterium]|nr:tRNA 4-thiouridine(8) synthase ThiI [Patescibacteria group bacterium]
MIKALLLFSGGLDSILAAKVLERQKIKVFPICFESYFFGCNLAKKSAKNLGLRLKIIDFSKEHLKIVKSPKYGYGKTFNPCIDCHLLMIKGAKKFLGKQKFDILATGEVLGERPFSQRKEIFKLIEKRANLENKILRPLSIKLLPETIYEKKNLIDRKKLFSIRGKSRKPQINLAKKFKIKEFPTPAGGCILTDRQYSERLKTLFKRIPDFNGSDTKILRKGRVFWKKNFLIVVGRNEKENKELKKSQDKDDLILEPENFPGPTVLIRGFRKKIKEDTIMKANELLLNYSKKLPEKIIIEIK